jgi:type II secretory pathway component PulJ
VVAGNKRRPLVFLRAAATKIGPASAVLPLARPLHLFSREACCKGTEATMGARNTRIAAAAPARSQYVDDEAASVGLTIQDRPFWLAAFVLLSKCGGEAQTCALQQVRLALAEDELERAEEWDRVLQAIRQVEELGPLPN